MRDHMTFENELLIEISRPNPAEDKLYRLAGARLDWDYILAQADRHRIQTLLYANLRNLPLLPDHYKRLLASHYSLKKLQGEAKMEGFKKVLQEIDRCGVKAVLLKGVYLASNLYQDPGLRPFADMDILIRPSDTERVFEILCDQGYSQSEPDKRTGELVKISEVRLRGYERELQHFGEFRKPGNTGNLVIDVHHRLSTIFDNYHYDVERLMTDAVADQVACVPVYRLKNEDFVTHLCGHVYWHSQSLRDIIAGRDMRLRDYSDILRFIETHPINWPMLLADAERTGLDSAVYYSMFHAQQIYGDVVPAEIYEKWDAACLASISNSIHDRWITRDTSVSIGHWDTPFLARLFDLNRSSKALHSFYMDYLEPALHRGAMLKLVEIDDTTHTG
jgi:Uncharacterised nucleotidyltransferase